MYSDKEVSDPFIENESGDKMIRGSYYYGGSKHNKTVRLDQPMSIMRDTFGFRVTRNAK